MEGGSLLVADQHRAVFQGQRSIGRDETIMETGDQENRCKDEVQEEIQEPVDWRAKAVEKRQQEDIKEDEELERIELAAQGKEMNIRKLQRLGETQQKQGNDILVKETENSSKNEVPDIKNHSGRDVAEMGLIFGCKEKAKIEGSPMSDTRGEPMIELRVTMEVLGLGSTINPPQKHNKVEDLDNSQLQPCAAVQFAREPWGFLIITTEASMVCFVDK
ncbi:hypothetical protein CR513_06832, partial [Mucuna pruriens]